MEDTQNIQPTCGMLRREPVFNKNLETVATALSFLTCDGNNSDSPELFQHALQLLNETAEQPVFGTMPTIVTIAAPLLDSLPKQFWPLPSKVLLIDMAGENAAEWRDHLEALTLNGFEYILSASARQLGQTVSPKACTFSGDDEAPVNDDPLVATPLWATGIKTRDRFKALTDNQKVNWFSGDFWKRPVVQAQRSLPASQVGSLRLLAQLQNPEVNINEVEQIVSCDATLTYKLLKLLNSAFFCAPSRVESIHHGVNFFGLQRIKNWATVIVMNSVDFLPHEILPLGAYRARLAETLAQAMKRPNASQYYLVGLFSILDALFDCTMEQIITPLHLHDEISRALTKHEGPAGELLHWILSIDQGQHVWASNLDQLQNLDLMRLQLDAYVWSNEFCRCLRGS